MLKGLAEMHMDPFTCTVSLHHGIQRAEQQSRRRNQ
jgi:hypothetical protein